MNIKVHCLELHYKIFVAKWTTLIKCLNHKLFLDGVTQTARWLLATYERNHIQLQAYKAHARYIIITFDAINV